MRKDITAYNDQQDEPNLGICQQLAEQIQTALPQTDSKIWHGAPVWFINDNPIVGYDVLKNCVRLLFWSGQSFEEPGLSPEGSFKAAEARYTNTDQIDSESLDRWLKKAQTIQWDYKNIRKRRGELVRI